MEILNGFELRPACPQDPQIDLQRAMADVREMGRIARSNALRIPEIPVGLSVHTESIGRKPWEDLTKITLELSSSSFRYINVGRSADGNEGGYVAVGYLDNLETFEEYWIRVPLHHNWFEGETTDGYGINEEDDVEPFKIEDLTDAQKTSKAAFIRRVLQKVREDLS